MEDEASAAMKRRIEDLDERTRGMFAHTLAQGAVVQAFLATVLGMSPPAVTEPLLRMIREPFSPGDTPLSDQAAAWWSDVEVARQAAVETMIERAQREVAKSQSQAPGSHGG